MARKGKKVEAKLNARIAAFDKDHVPANMKTPGMYTKPGSRNPKK